MLPNTFENIKKINKNGQEYWLAREFAKTLGYSDFGNFENVIKKAKKSCKNASQKTKDHFAGVTEMVDIGSDTQREFPSYELSRYACYLIAQNGDPRKVEIAKAQTYFAINMKKYQS